MKVNPPLYWWPFLFNVIATLVSSTIFSPIFHQPVSYIYKFSSFLFPNSVYLSSDRHVHDLCFKSVSGNEIKTSRWSNKKDTRNEHHFMYTNYLLARIDLKLLLSCKLAFRLSNELMARLVAFTSDSVIFHHISGLNSTKPLEALWFIVHVKIWRFEISFFFIKWTARILPCRKPRRQGGSLDGSKWFHSAPIGVNFPKFERPNERMKWLLASSSGGAFYRMGKNLELVISFELFREKIKERTSLVSFLFKSIDCRAHCSYPNR